ncbi:discoidin domain-containing protein [Nonomuraea maritima]|uniref:discoidin domain-containing protein n=1 Tax=Nonomuraea maritima TaxID=683260 RepID=UPI00371C038C
MSAQPPSLSRRSVVLTGATLLAGFGAGLTFPSPSRADARTPRGGAAPEELAAYRPITVSSTDYAPTPGEFAVDRLKSVGVRGSGWRAAAGDPQWICVDLQAECDVTALRLTFEATADDPVFVPSPNGSPRDNTTGQEILSSCAVAYVIETSRDNRTWTAVHRTDSGAGGVEDIALAQPARARWVRMTVTKRSNANPLGLNGFEVYGTTRGHRPSATGWTDWGTHHHKAPKLEVAADGTVPLESGWTLTMDDWAGGDGAALSRPAVDTSAWLPATVPGTVLGTLVEQGHLPDPVAGFNNLHIPEALSRHSWWYRRGFDLPRGLPTGPGRHVWLEFDGINHKADIWLNGQRVGDLTYPFGRSAHDITGLLTAHGEQALAVQITPMPFPGSPGDKGPEGLAFVDAGANMMNRNSPTYLASSGWDWMPAVRDRVSGIWNHVRLRSTGHAVLGDPRVDTKLPGLPDTRTAELTIVVPVRNAGESELSVAVSAAFGDVRVSQTVTVPAGESVDVTFSPATHDRLRLRDPKLWWPNGYGEPHLHGLTLVASVDGHESDRRVTRFGIRQFGYEQHVPLPFGGGSDSYVQSVDLGEQQAQYVRIMCLTRATDWGSSLWALSVYDDAAPGVDLALHKDATASSSDEDAHAPGNVTDGDAGTRWASKFADNEWIRVDLGAKVSFRRIDLTWEQAYAATYVVQVSDDDSTWRDVAAVDNSAVPLPFNRGDASLQTVDFPARTARHVRIACGQRATGWGNSLWTLSVINSAAPQSDLARGKRATASTEESGNPAANATDGNPNTRWVSDYADNQSIQVDLESSVTFDRIVILWEVAHPKTYTIQVSDDGATWTDVKTVDLAPEPLKISVNGVRVFARGGNWGWDELLRRMPDTRMDAAVRMHRDMNFTMIRNWVGSSTREEFYAGCDEHGLLVWNDFPNAWAMDPPDHQAYNDLARDTVRRYRIHPSVVVWCGANEGNPPAAIDEGMRTAVESEAPGILYQNNSAGGTVTGGGPYGWVEPQRYYSPSTYGSQNFGFHTEIGMPVVSTAESVRNLAGSEPEWPIGGVWYYHDWSTRGNQAPQNYQAAIETRLGPSDGLDDFARKAQFVNYENGRAMFEAWNAHLWQDATGLMLWMSHPAWHSTVWQTYDYDFDVNGMYYGTRTACEPVHVQAGLDDWKVLAVNHTARELKGVTVTAQAYDLRGRGLGAPQRKQLDVASSATAEAFTAGWTDDLPDLHLLRLTLEDGTGRTLSRNDYWRYREPADLRALNDARRVKVTASVGKVTKAGTRRVLTAELRNRGDAVAAMVRLTLVDDRSGERVLPTLYSDNYVWLLPGESRTVELSWPADSLPTGRPAVRVEGYNVDGVTAR